VLVDFFVINDAKIPIFGAALGVCKVKNRFVGDFLRLCAKRNKLLEYGNPEDKAQGKGPVSVEGVGHYGVNDKLKFA
jgi:hypothetical protein